MSDETTNEGGLTVDNDGTANLAGTLAGRDVVYDNSEAVNIAQQLISTGSEKDTLYGSALLGIIERSEEQIAIYRRELAQVYQERRAIESLLASDTSQLEIMREQLDRHREKQQELEKGIESCLSAKRWLLALVIGSGIFFTIVLFYLLISGQLLGAGAMYVAGMVAAWVGANP